MAYHFIDHIFWVFHVDHGPDFFLDNKYIEKMKGLPFEDDSDGTKTNLKNLNINSYAIF